MSLKIPPISQLKMRDWHELNSEKLLLHLRRRSFYSVFKRIADIIISLVAIIICWPFWILIIIWIRLDSPGKAIFAHERVGIGGRLFRLYKFRSMFISTSAQEFAPTAAADPRVTRIGRFLRKTSLDEFPQVINVLKGDMSIVGPRPEMKFIVDTYNDLHKKRLLVKPGITGLWQVMGRKDLPLHENAEYDYYYILNRSLWLDLLILWKTFYVVIKGKGAY